MTSSSSKHPFDAYNSRHGHGPQIRISSGVQRLTITFHRGYVHVKASPPYGGEVYFTRTAFFTLLRKAVPIARLWAKSPAPDWDVPKAVHEAYLLEQSLSQELREQKKLRRSTLEDHDRRERQRRRFLAAKARAQRARAR